MRAVLLSLLCSCATPVTVTPASLPYLPIDPALEGPVMSMKAAEIFAIKRRRDKAEFDKKIADEQAKTKVAVKQRDRETQRADRGEWWATYGPLVALGGALGWIGWAITVATTTGGLRK